MSSELYPSSRHRYRCGVDGCWRERALSPAVGQGHGYSYFGDYCEEHTCAVDSCHIPNDSDAPYCDEHRCWHAECPQPSMAAVGGYDPRSRACPDHTCLVEDCPATSTLDSRHCEAHTCLRRGCPTPKSPSSPVCADHTCAAPGCARQRRHRRGSEACAAHTCRAEGCYRAQTDGSARPYCPDHICKWAFKPCPRAAQKTGDVAGGGAGGSDYCDSHRCVVASCPLPCRRSGRLCADHGCWFDAGGGGGEGGGAAECASGPKGLGRFCAAHTCRVRRCLEAVAPAQQGQQQQRRFCIVHACAWPGTTTTAASAVPSQPPCPMRRRGGDGGGGGFCEGHGCAQRGCPRPREVESQPFCAEHEGIAKERRAAKEKRAAEAAAEGSVMERSRRGPGGGGGPAGAGVPPGQLSRMFQEDPRAVYAMAYTQGWEGKGGRERYDRLRSYLDGAMESQLRLWALETEGMEEPRMILPDPVAEEVKSPIPEEMKRPPTDSPLAEQAGGTTEPAPEATAGTAS